MSQERKTHGNVGQGSKPISIRKVLIAKGTPEIATEEERRRLTVEVDYDYYMYVPSRHILLTEWG
jgi:hypothetical protein